MKIDIIISVDDIKKEKIQGKTVVVIDMLRATSVIVTALANGCSDVIPVTDIEEARNLANSDRETYILGGERNSVKIEGFDFSNSPLDYTKDIVKDKTLIMTTTNGTNAIHGALGAKNILIGALINAKAVARRSIELNNDLVIINAGTHGEFSMDDFICSGYIIDCILNDTTAKLSDIATTAHYVYTQNTNIISFLSKANHYNFLLNLELKKDIEYCCKKDIIPMVPQCEITSSGLRIQKK